MIDDGDRLPAFPETATCPYCRGSLRHHARQRCPAAPPLATQAPTAPPATVVAGEFVRPNQRGTSFPASGYGLRRRPGAKQASPFGFWRFIGAATGTITLMVCVSVYAWLIFDDLTSAYQGGGEALLWIGATVLIGLTLGAGVLWMSWRAYAKAVFVFLAATLILLGYFMLVFAPVYRQINAGGIAEYQASNALFFFGFLTVGSGVALSGLCLRWALEPEALAALNRWRRPIGAAYGVLLGLFGLFVVMTLGLVLVAADNSSDFEADDIETVALVIAFTALAMQFFVPGIILVYHGIRSSIGSGTTAFRPPWAIVIAGVFGIVLVIGQANMRLESPYAWPMPALHTFAAVIPGATYIALAMRASWLRGRLVRGITWRQVTLAWGLAIAVGAMMAGFVNSIAGLGVTVLLLVYNGAFEDVSAVSGGSFEYDVWDVISDADLWLTNTQQWVANIIAIAIIPPFAEEFLKGLSVRFLLRKTMTRGQAFALGAAAGAGFGFVEALLYGAGVVSDDLSAWWQIMLLRAGSTSLHCLATGLVGLGWWYWTNGNDKRRAVSLYFTAVILHALWNGFSVTLDSEIFWIGTLEDTTIEYIAYGFVIVMAATFIWAIPRIARGLREPPPPPVGETPLGAMRPWMAY